MMTLPIHPNEKAADASRGALRNFESLVNEHYGKIFGVAFAWLRNADAAEDLAQEVVLRAYLYLHGGGTIVCFSSWCGTVARNLAANWIRSGQRQSRLVEKIHTREMTMRSDTHTGASARDQAQQNEEIARLHKALDALPAPMREVVMLHYVDGCSKSDIARVTGRNPSTVGRLLKRALHAMKMTLDTAPAQFAPMRVSDTGHSRRVALLLAGIAGMSAASKDALAAQCADTAQLCAGSLQSAAIIPGKALVAAAAKPVAALLVGAVLLVGVYSVTRQSRHDTGTSGSALNGSGQSSLPRTRVTSMSAREPAAGSAAVSRAAAADSSAKHVPAKPASQPAMAATADRAAKLSDRTKISFRIVDSQQAPVAGATATVVQIWSSNPNMSQGIVVGPAVSDAAGSVTLEVPDHTAFMSRTDRVSLKVEHPNYATVGQVIELAAMVPVVLKPGDSFVLRPVMENGRVVPPVGMHIVASESAKMTTSAWAAQADGSWVSHHMPSGEHYLYVSAQPEGQASLVSDMIKVTLPRTESGPLQVVLHPTFTLAGKLSPEVPRPVVNGKVQVRAWHDAGTTGSAPVRPYDQWQYGENTRGMKYGLVSAEIATDGTFKVPGLPRTSLKLVAMCDGWISRQGVVESPGDSLAESLALQVQKAESGQVAPEEAIRLRNKLKRVQADLDEMGRAAGTSWLPQSLEFPGDRGIEVPMERTGSVRLLLHAKDGAAIGNASFELRTGLTWGLEWDRDGWIGGITRGVTDSKGEALIPSVPPASVRLWGVRNAAGVWETTKRESRGPNVPPGIGAEFVQVFSGETRQYDIELELYLGLSNTAK